MRKQEFNRDHPSYKRYAKEVTEFGKVFVYISGAYPLIFSGYEYYDLHNLASSSTASSRTSQVT
jgi:hypothetical protein